MKFSVIIPLYNKERYIKKTLRSVLKQNFKDFEVIVVDDGSTDKSLNLAKEIVSEKIKIIQQSNQGVAVARNTAIENAMGEYIAFLDADDMWYPEYLETINNLIKKFPESDIFVTAYRIVMGNNKYNYSAHLSDEEICIESYWKTYQNIYDVAWTSVTTIKRSAIIKAGKFTPGEKIGEDLALWAKIACINPKVGYSPKICADYNRSAEQNARTRVKIAYPKELLSVLSEEMRKEHWTNEEKKWMLSKYNKKMIVYVFTLILANERKKARKVLYEWKKQYPNKYIWPLYIASILPVFINRYVYSVRMKIF